MKPILETCMPRPEVLKGDLQDALFAADFGHVVEGVAPDVYQNPLVFFRNTHPAARLKQVIATVFERLADPGEPGATLRLSTGFGGGKTHALIALWHLARNIAQLSLGTELLPAAGRPAEVVVAGVDGRSFGSSVCGAHGELQTHSLWGELAYQLGGVEGYRALQAFDDPLNVPNAGAVRAMLPDKPLLVLIDELVIYMAHLNAQAQNAILAFINTLMAEIGARRQAVLVITDPAGQPAYEQQAQELKEAVERAAGVLDDVLGRRVSDYDPIGEETAEVITRRLFERIGRQAAEEASAEYYNAYKRIQAESPGTLPPEAATADYARQIVRCYPFHPRLLLTAQDRLGALQGFHKSRGVLRLFARILRDVWDKGRALYLISAGDLDWTSPRIQADLLQRLARDRFMPAVDADVVQHAGRLDADYSTDIHRRVASALLLESLPLTGAAAMDKRDLTLAVLRPNEAGHEPGEALDRLMSVCWHTYKDPGGTRFQFRYEPNANKIIEERANEIPREDARQAVLTLAQSYFGGHIFRLVAWPSSAKAVPDGAELQLVLSESEALAQAVCDYQDDSNPEAKFPRRFRNAILGIAPTPSLLEEAVATVRRLKAAERVRQEEQAKLQGKRGTTPLLEEVERLLPLFSKRARFQTYRAFNRVVFQGRPSVTLSERYLVSDESALAQVHGQEMIKKLLDDENLIYQPGDALDTDLLLAEILPGATPSLEFEGAYPASAVHERALAHPRLRLMLNGEPLQRAILNALREGKLLLRQPDGDVYDAQGRVSGPPGARRREEGAQPYAVALRSDVLLAPPDAPCAAEWLRVSEPIEEGEPQRLALAEAARAKGASEEQIGEALDVGLLHGTWQDGERLVVVDAAYRAWSPPSTLDRPVTTTSWEEAIAYAARRPLLDLKLWVDDLSSADRLLSVAQPLGASALRLSVQASAVLSDGGSANLSVENVRHNNPLNPLDMAKRLLRGAQGGSAYFRATLALDFAGRPMPNAGAKLEQARAAAGGRVQLEAEFGPVESAGAAL
ncbi:MAG: ATP-binding protein [Chloroflexi bacterium]|nr:ATP-binding protein [Chloroflexota bacterium]